jgi:holo-[acyl-carrier protein] synthase
MIIALGIDLIEIELIKNSILRSEKFINRVYTPQEILYCENRKNKYTSYSARFAVKEAVMKALGTGWDKGVQWKQIEVINQSSFYSKSNSDKNSNSLLNDGKPEVKLSGKALEISKNMGVQNIYLSLSHSKCSAIANVIFEG